MLRIGKKGALIIAVLFAFSVLTSCGGGGGGGVFFIGPITVNGIVVDDTNTPVSGADIILNNEAATLVTTGLDGTFKFTGVETPYTLTMKTGTDITEYRGLFRSNPELTTGGGAYYSTTLDGIVTGPTYTLPSDQGIVMGATNNVFGGGSADSGTGDFSVQLAWLGTPSKKTDLAALLFTHDSNLITGYLRTGTLTGVNLVSGAPQTGLTVALSRSVATASTVLQYDPGAYSANVNGNYLILKANGAKFIIGGGNIPSGTSVLLPNGGGTFLVRGDDVDGNSFTRIGAAVLGGTTKLDFPSSTGLTNSLPLNGAIDVSKTPTLSWTPVDGADVYGVSLSGPGINYEVFLPGSSSTLTIPDYTVFGMPLAGNTTYTWRVVAFTAGGWSMNFLTDPATGGASELNLYQASKFTLYQTHSTGFTTVP